MQPAMLLNHMRGTLKAQGNFLLCGQTYILGLTGDFIKLLLRAIFNECKTAYERGDYLRARGFLSRYESVAPPSAQSLMLGYRTETRLDDTRAATQYRNQILGGFPDSAEAAELRDAGRP